MYAKISNNTVYKYPVFLEDIRQEHPETSFPTILDKQVLDGFGLVLVNRSPTPPFNPTSHKAKETLPVSTDSGWVQTWEVVELTEEEKEQKRKQIQTDIEARVRMSLEAFVQQRGYDNVTSAVSYANSTNTKYAEEAARVIELRDDTWSALFQIFEDVEMGVRPPVLSYDEIVDELPLLAW